METLEKSKSALFSLRQNKRRADSEIGIHRRHYTFYKYSFSWRDSPLVGQGLPCRGCLITVSHTILGRTPLDERSARLRDLCVTTHGIHRTHINVTGGIRTRNPSKLAAADPRLRPRGHFDPTYILNTRGKCNA